MSVRQRVESIGELLAYFDEILEDVGTDDIWVKESLCGGVRWIDVNIHGKKTNTTEWLSVAAAEFDRACVPKDQRSLSYKFSPERISKLNSEDKKLYDNLAKLSLLDFIQIRQQVAQDASLLTQNV